jgi:hypothetical protein
VTRLTTTYESKLTEVTTRSKMQQESSMGADLERLNLLLTNKNAEI